MQLQDYRTKCSQKYFQQTTSPFKAEKQITCWDFSYLCLFPILLCKKLAFFPYYINIIVNKYVLLTTIQSLM